MPLCLATKYLIFLPISELASIKDLDNSILLSENMKYSEYSSKQTLLENQRTYILHTIKKTISVTLSVYLCFDNVWRENITDCVIQSWPSGGLRLVADRNKKTRRFLDLITALLKFKSSISTTVAAQCRFQSSP